MAEVGQNAEHVTVGKNIIVIGALHIPFWVAVILAMAAVLIAVFVGRIAFFAGQPSSLALAPTVIAPLPTPTPWMTGVVNVAVAGFGMRQSSEGPTQSAPEGFVLANELYASLSNTVSANLAPISVQWLGPTEVGAITGPDAESRNRSAAARADEINADLLIFGDLSVLSSSTTLAPMIYVASRNLGNAEEMEDVYPLAPITVNAAITKNPTADLDLRESVAEQVGALADVVWGLGLFNRQRYAASVPYFEDAQRMLGDDLNSQKMLLLFMGSAAAQQGDLVRATAMYHEALALSPSFARARLGLALLELTAGWGECTPETIDESALERAIAAFEAVQRPPSISTSLAAVPTKVNLGLGMVYLCRSMAGSQEWASAEDHLNAVVVEYVETQEQRIEHLAALAHLQLARLILQRDAVQVGSIATWAPIARQNLEAALALTLIPDDRVEAHLLLAVVAAEQGDCPTARVNYEAAAVPANEAAGAGHLVDLQDLADFATQQLDERCPRAAVTAEGGP